MVDEREKRLFSSNAQEPMWDRLFTVDRLLENPVEEREIDGGIVLPLRVRDDVVRLDEAYEGGVCYPDGSFAAGLRRDYVKEHCNISVCKSYVVPQEEVERVDETVVFGGILQEHFGDMLTMTTTRLWWYAEHKDTPLRFVFLERPNAGAYQDSLLNLIGLTRDRMIIVDHPMQFTKVIVPDEACYILTRASRKWLEPFELAKKLVADTLPASECKKLYLSRTAYEHYAGGDGVGEEYYERFFEKRGFTVVHLQKLPLAQQVNLLMHAEEIVCTFGTLGHMALFAKDGIKQTCLLRSPELWIQQAVINTVRNIDWYWVEGTINPLASSHDYGWFLYHPTPYFRAYLESQGIAYTKEEFEPALPSREMIMDYIVRWAQHYADPWYYRRLRDYTAFDEVKALNRALFGRELDRKDYAKSRLELLYEQLTETEKQEKAELRAQKKAIKELEKTIARQKVEEKRLTAKMEKAERELEKMRNSTSWKVTKPLRSAMDTVKKLRKS